MYLLDTNICIYLMKRKFPSLENRVKRELLSNLSVSAITVAELEYGVLKSHYPEKNRLLLYAFLTPFQIIPFEAKDAENFGHIRAYLNKKGTLIGAYDLQLAAQCLSRDICMVTNNVKEFERVPLLKIENWVG